MPPCVCLHPQVWLSNERSIMPRCWQTWQLTYLPVLDTSDCWTRPCTRRTRRWWPARPVRRDPPNQSKMSEANEGGKEASKKVRRKKEATATNTSLGSHKPRRLAGNRVIARATVPPAKKIHPCTTKHCSSIKRLSSLFLKGLL